MKNNKFQTIIAVALVAIIQSSYAQNPILMNSGIGASTTPGAINSAMIQSNNNIGIGTSSAGARLQIYNANPTGTAALAINNSVLAQSGYSYGNYIHIQTYGVGAPINIPTKDHFIINTDGKTGVGTGTPVAQLEVKSTDSWNPFQVLNSSNTSALMVTTAGNVGIGTTTPTEKLQVVGNILASGNITGTAIVGNGSVISNGLLWIGGNSVQVGNNLLIGNTIIGGNLYSTTSNKLEVLGTTQLSGNTTVGTTSANSNLTVNGDISIKNRVAIGNQIPNGIDFDYKLCVDGKAVAKEFVVQTNSWQDTVFSESYQLRPIEEVQAYIKANKHLPEIPAEKEVISNGISIGEMNQLFMKKIEELTLYIIQLKEENKAILEQLKKQ